MTIKELESRTGMARANIRFYESEGLLAPKRLDNGYRDYSEEDARTLEKIKLLRQLQLDIDTIRKVQQGTLTLEQALFVQHTKLEGDRAVIGRAAEVCRAIGESGVEYAALEPQPWLVRLEPPPTQPVLPGPPPKPPRPEQDDTPRACYHPWMRWLARLLDMAIYDTVFTGLWLVLFRDQAIVRATGVLAWVLGLLLLGFTLAVEPLWLHFWGWTPGKWVFGLKLRDGDGNKLGLQQAFRRSSVLIWEGYALNIPIYGWWVMWKCREQGLEGRDCCWDGEEGYRYTKEERRNSAILFIGARVVCAGVVMLGVLFSQMPLCRGSLAIGQVAQNYGHYYKMLVDAGEGTVPKLDETGRFYEWEPPKGVAVIDLGGGAEWDDPVYATDHGQVTSVTLRVSGDPDIFYNTGVRETLMLLALSGGAERLNLFNYDLRGWAKVTDETFLQWQDADLNYRGLHITQQVMAEGYDVAGSGMLWSQEDTPHHMEKIVTISLID